MVCPNCKHQQDSGKFCGVCGTILATQNVEREEALHGSSVNAKTTMSSAAVPAYQAPAEPNQHVEKVKETSKQYWNYFLHYFKKPGTIMENPAHSFINACITIAIFAIIFSLSIHKNLSIVLQPLEELGGFLGEQPSMMPSFVSIFFSSALSIILIFLLSMASIFVVNKMAGPVQSFKNILSAFGTLLIPPTVLLAVAYILLLIESYVIGNTLVIVSLSFSISVLPLYLITVLLKQSSKVVDSYYAFIAYIILFAISLSILVSIFFDSTIGRYIETIRDGFYY